MNSASEHLVDEIDFQKHSAISALSSAAKVLWLDLLNCAWTIGSLRYTPAVALLGNRRGCCTSSFDPALTELVLRGVIRIHSGFIWPIRATYLASDFWRKVRPLESQAA